MDKDRHSLDLRNSNKICVNYEESKWSLYGPTKSIADNIGDPDWHFNPYTVNITYGVFDQDI